MNGCCEARIPTPPAPTASHDESLIRLRKLEGFLATFILINNGPNRYFENDISPIAPGLVGAFSVVPTFGLVFRIEPEMDQRVVPLAGLHDDITALASITAGRSSARDELLAPESHTAVSTVAGFDSNFGFVDEHWTSVVCR
jgi:hypothetical protein